MRISLGLTKAECDALMTYELSRGMGVRPSIAAKTALFKVRSAIVVANRVSAASSSVVDEAGQR